MASLKEKETYRSSSFKQLEATILSVVRRDKKTAKQKFNIDNLALSCGGTAEEAVTEAPSSKNGKAQPKRVPRQGTQGKGKGTSSTTKSGKAKGKDGNRNQKGKDTKGKGKTGKAGTPARSAGRKGKGKGSDNASKASGNKGGKGQKGKAGKGAVKGKRGS
eukprot:TRINITY_DN72746_c0_g1_i1.p2 TRINITY_DN72746_c0_g1~~TRINITY_DN72746_c0_g1_i1.p2  ORF type:complete len:169 (-),score=43.90 TRINITY_DN72746_c0_g1_i1:600-1082(-)